MGKILLIEPHKVLQQAIALSLFPEHEVQVEPSVEASGIDALQGVDLLIVDASALRETNQLSPELARAIQSSQIPTVWIEENESARPPKRDKLEVVMKPVESEAFQSALAGLLSPSSGQKESKKARAAGDQKSQKNKTARKAAADPIELTEVVEEESSSPSKSK